MPMGRPKPLLLLGPEESEQLRAVASSRTLPHGLVLRARIILLSASGMNNQAIAARLCLNPVTVGHPTGLGRAARRVAPWPPAVDQRRTSGSAGSQDVASGTPARHALELPFVGCPDSHLENHGAPHLESFRTPAASAAPFPVVQRSLLRREGAGYRGFVFEPAGQSRGLVCR